MALTPSNMLALGTSAPDFKLIDTISNELLSLDNLKGQKGTLILFICNHCPFVIHLNSKIVELATIYQEKGINFIAISSNDVVNYPQDSPEKMKAHAKTEGYNFPYLYDESQEVAKLYDAACTPDFYLFNDNLKLVYRGQFCDSRPNSNIEVTGKDIINAFDNLLAKRPQTEKQLPSVGCNIKWK